MSTIAASSSTTNNSLLRLSLIGGIISGFLHLLIQQGIVFGLILKTPIISSLQFVASGIMGDAAFTGGLATALLGLVLDFIMITIMAGVFIFSVDRIPLLRRNVIVGSILYGFGVFIVMNLISCLSAPRQCCQLHHCGYSSNSSCSTFCSSGCH